jgi:hypothetical protein
MRAKQEQAMPILEVVRHSGLNIAIPSQFCLYCDEPATSREHILCSGLGEQLVDSTLICGTHNNRAGEFADDPLAKRFAYAVHCLDVLKCDGTRGTTWHGLPTSDGITIDIRPDRSTRMKTIIKRDNEGLPVHIIGTEHKVIEKIERDLARLPSPPIRAAMTETLRDDVLQVEINTGGDSFRGIVKAAFHFGASLTTDRASARAPATTVGPIIFSTTDSVAILRYAPYETSDRKRGHEFHELIAWPFEGGTFVLVKLFNVVTFLVRLNDLAGVSPRRYLQQIRTGERVVESVDAPALSWDQCSDDPTPEWRAELDWRINQVVEVGRCKAEIVKLMEAAKKADGYAALLPDAERQALWNAITAFKPAQTITSRTRDAVVYFATTRIFEETPQAMWLPQRKGTAESRD